MNAVRSLTVTRPPTRDRPWVAVGSTVPGSKHLDRGRGGEDAFAFAAWPTNPRVMALAVADGASSQPRSALGAQLAVSIATNAAIAALDARGIPRGHADWEQLLDDLLDHTVTRFVSVTASLAPESPPATAARQFGTTLAFALLAPPRLATFSVGDGAVVVRSADCLCAVCGPPMGRQDDTLTVFLSSPAARREAQRLVLLDHDVGAVAMWSDGLHAAALDSARVRPRPSFLLPILDAVGDAGVAAAGELTEFLLCSSQLATVTNDDKTLLVAVPG